jgi:Rad3-related DNA helicase
LVRKFVECCDEFFEKRRTADFYEMLLEVYFEALSFIRISEYYDERYVTYIEKQGSDIKLKLFCLDPSYLLQEAAKRGKSSSFFSATLSPLDYFTYMLGGCSESLKVRIPSPFPQSNLCLLLADNISTRYKHREMTYEAVADMIYSVTIPRRGNYLAYFPSYKYMNEVIQRFNHESEMDIIFQTPVMGEVEKEEFLSSFSENNENALLGFGVLGGMFGEGIDLLVIGCQVL